MILFDLLCANDHRFEGWFKSGNTFDAQVAAEEVACPVCGDTGVRKALSAPALIKGSGEVAKSNQAAIAVKLREAMFELRHHIEANCDYVGERFPEEARRIHYGEAEERAIYGEATADQAEELHEEGIEVVAIPWPSRHDS